ncbi:hypothetical protein SDJN02_09429, partial [Cucurbita argyrosperma subsp. argyrosperma]
MKGENWEGLKFGEEVENGKIGRGMQEEDDEDGRTESLSLSLSLFLEEKLRNRRLAPQPQGMSHSIFSLSWFRHDCDSWAEAQISLKLVFELEIAGSSA